MPPPQVKAHIVFPAYAGLIPEGMGEGRQGKGIPRIRGVDPSFGTPPHLLNHTVIPAYAGLIPCDRRRKSHVRLFPAYAGLFPGIQLRSRLATAIPRTRGVVPDDGRPLWRLDGYSPRMRD